MVCPVPIGVRDHAVIAIRQVIVLLGKRHRYRGGGSRNRRIQRDLRGAVNCQNLRIWCLTCACNHIPHLQSRRAWNVGNYFRVCRYVACGAYSVLGLPNVGLHQALPFVIPDQILTQAISQGKNLDGLIIR